MWLLFLSACTSPLPSGPASTTWITAEPWDPLSVELLACDAVPASVRWVSESPLPGIPHLLPTNDAVPEPLRDEPNLGHISRNGRTAIATSCDHLGVLLADSQSPDWRGAPYLDLMRARGERDLHGVMEALHAAPPLAPRTANHVAWLLASHDDADETHHRAAIQLVEPAIATLSNDPRRSTDLAETLDTLAHAQWRLGLHDEAITTQKRAVALLPGLPAHTLHRYEEDQGLPPTDPSTLWTWGIPAPPHGGTYPAEHVAEDLVFLSEHLRGRYGGWNEALRSDLERERARLRSTTDPLSEDDALATIVRATQSIQDTHFQLWPRGGDAMHRVRSVRPTFAPDLELAGAAPPVPSPDEIELGRTYAFPTWDGGTMLGTFEIDEGGPPTTTETHVRVLREPVTTLVVPTLTHAVSAELPATAEALRDTDALVIDLRGNGGGGYEPLWAWLTAFSDVAHQSAGTSHRTPEGWTSYRHRTVQGEAGPYAGQLYILIDGGTASAAEAFAIMARQIPGALLVGQPTRGCSDVGDQVEAVILPHTGAYARFGHTAYGWDALQPFAEGVGIFPDIWTDDDPMQAIAAAQNSMTIPTRDGPMPSSESIR